MIASGTTLIEPGAAHPRCFQLGDEAYPNGWKSVRHTLTFHELEVELAATGWTFFFMGNLVQESAFGFDRAKMTDAALKRVIASVKKQGCNCLEIDAVTAHSFLWIPYMSVSAHPRHIQKGMVFGEPTFETTAVAMAASGSAS